MTLGLAIYDGTRLQTRRSEMPPLSRRRKTETSEFDVNLYRYDEGSSRRSTDVPSLVTSDTSSTPSLPSTPEDEFFNPQRGGPSAVIAKFERRVDGGVRPRDINAGKPELSSPASSLVTPAASASKRMTIGSIGRSLRRTLSRHPSSSSSGTSAPPSPPRHKTQMPAATPSTSHSAITPSNILADSSPVDARQAAHAALADNHHRSRSASRSPARTRSTTLSSPLPPVPVPAPKPTAMAPKVVVEPAQRAHASSRRDKVQKRPRTAPNPETSKLLPSVPALQGEPALIPLQVARERLAGSGFINPWVSGSPRAASTDGLSSSPCGRTTEPPSPELSRASSPPIAVVSSRQQSTRRPSLRSTAYPTSASAAYSVAGEDRRELADLVSPLDDGKRGGFAAVSVSIGRSSSADAAFPYPTRWRRRQSSSDSKTSQREAETVWEGPASHDLDALFPSTPSEADLETGYQAEPGSFWVDRDGPVESPASRRPMRERRASSLPDPVLAHEAIKMMRKRRSKDGPLQIRLSIDIINEDVLVRYE